MPDRMPSRPVGFYVHYHGRGHRNRTLAILRELAAYDRPAAVLTSLMADLDWPANVTHTVDLACDDHHVPPDGLRHRDEMPAAHYAPLHAWTIRRRVHQLAEWFDAANPAALVVDVSCEVATLARLASVPTVLMRQHGDRRDVAHENAYRSARRLLAPFPASMEDDLTPDWVREKTTYAAGFCRYDQPPPPRDAARAQLGWTSPHVVVMTGRGGDGTDLSGVADAARATPDWTWVVIGMVADESDPAALPPNVTLPGWIDDPLPILAGADAVVSAAGHNSVMELAHARARTVIIPESRPFAEQVRKAAILDRDGLAIVRDRWPDAADWPGILRDASQLDPHRWDPLFDGAGGAATLAAAIEEVAAESDGIDSAAPPSDPIPATEPPA